MKLCKNFLKDFIRIEGVEKLTERLKTDCIFYFDDDDVSCFQRNDDFSELGYYCLICHITFLFELLKNYMFFSY